MDRTAIEDGTKYFRESFRGFNKDDVISFIAKATKEHSDIEEKYKKEISEAKADLTKKAEELKNMTKTLDSLKSDNQKKVVDAAAIQIKYTTLCEEYERQRAVIEAMPAAATDNEKIKEELRQQIAKSNEKLAESESEKAFMLDVIKKFELETGVRTADICDAESLKNKKISFENNMIDMAEAAKKIAVLEEEIFAVRKENEELLEIRNKTNELSDDEQKIYETITSELGNVIYSAKKTAETIVEKAKIEAEDILNKANAKRAIFFEQYEKDVFKLKKRYEEIREDYKKAAERFKMSYNDFATELLDVEQSIEDIYNKL